MNKKIIILVTGAVMAAVFLLMGIDLAIGHLVPTGHLHSLLVDAIEGVAVLRAFPSRLFALFYHGTWSWSLWPVEISLLALSGLIWGVVLERVIWLCSKRNKAQ